MLQTRFTRTLAAIAGSAALVVALSACTSILEGPSPVTPERTPPPPPETTPELVPGGTAEENLEYFRSVLRTYSESEQPILGEPIVNAVAESGFEKGDMQVSHDRSRTGLVADSMYVAVRLGETCLLGQFVTDNREWAAYAADAVGPENNVCMIGDTRPIDW